MYTYTLLELQSKTFGELKKIGWELNVIPEGDRRRRETWIDAIAGVNPPLLQLLEVSPAADDIQAQELPIIETVEASPGVEVGQAQEPPIESKFGRIVYPRPTQGAIVQNEETTPDLDRTGGADVHNRSFHPTNSDGDNSSIEAETLGSEESDRVLAVAGNHQAVRGLFLPHQSLKLAAENSPAVEVDQLPECSHCFDDGYFEDESGLIKSCVCSFDPKLSRQNAQRAIVPAAKNLPGRSKTSTAHQLLELFKSSAHIIDDSPASETELKVSQSAIEQAGKNQESDLTPILTGLSLSDRFLARYSPPQSEVFQFQADADGQLTLIDFKVQSAPEPPDPDDFDSLDAFREAIALWDSEHCETDSDHCEHSFVHSQPNSVHCQPPDPSDYDSMFAFWAAYDAWDEASDDDSEPSSIDKPPSSIDKLPSSIDKPLEVSLDSFCEWAPCPDEWYEPVALLEQAKVSELSPGCQSSITSDFFIPTFDTWCDRANRQTDTDEPPDTGIFARLPGPKPPRFPPRAIGYTQPNSPLNAASRNYSETIPKLFSRVAAGSRTQPARSPPGGDA